MPQSTRVGHSTDRLPFVASGGVLVNFAIWNRFDIFTGSGYSGYVVNHTLACITSDVISNRINTAIGTQQLTLVEITDREEIKVYATYLQRFGDSAAACLAVASCRGWFLADDSTGAVQREVLERFGSDKLMTTGTILDAAVTKGCLTDEAAVAMRADLEQGLGSLSRETEVYPWP